MGCDYFHINVLKTRAKDPRLKNLLGLGCFPTWCLSTSAWAPAQNSVAYRHLVLQVPISARVQGQKLVPGQGHWARMLHSDTWCSR